MFEMLAMMLRATGGGTMGTISSGTGLISGLDIQSLVTQLMAIEARPLQQLQARAEQTQQEQTAYLELSARLLSVKGVMSRLARASAFTNRSATSSAPDRLSATATSSTPIDTYSFQVASLVAAHQLVSRGFADRDTTPIGSGTLTFEVGQGRVNTSTSLSALNNYEGIRRGSIRITDQSGDSAVIDLSHTLTIDDVLDAINSETGITVSARVSGDHLVITDESGDSETELKVQDVAGGSTARGLGIARSDNDDGATDGVINGMAVIAMTEASRLSSLNDHMGVRVDGVLDDLQFTLTDGRTIDVNLSSRLQFNTKLAALNDGRGVRDEGGQRIIRVTDRTGASAQIDLSSAENLQDVVDALSASGLSVAMALSGSKILITDDSGATDSNLIIEDVTGYAAADLGIEADVDDNVISGKTIYRVDTVGAVLRAIQYAEGNIDGSYPAGALTASISNNGVVFVDHTSGSGITMVEALNNSKALDDLGMRGGFSGDTLTSRKLMAGLNTVLLASLKGGSGIDIGTVQFTLRDGTVTGPIDFTTAQTLHDVVDTINGVTGLSAEVDSGGTGIVITDTTGGSGTLQATDLTGSTVADLGLTSAAADRLASSDLQLRYIAENTLLADLNQGNGISFGKMQITNSDGVTATLTLSEGAHKTVGDVIDAINALSIDVVARINDDGDGIELEDTAGGTGTLTVAEVSGASTAADLGILGTATGNMLTGRFAISVEIDGDDTLSDLVEKINSAGAGVTASIINDGTPFTPYRLVLTSDTGGTSGLLSYRIDGTKLSLETLTEARDAAVVLGDPDSSNSIMLTSSSNTISDVVPGLTLNLLGTSTQSVQVTVAQDVESLISDMQAFVKNFNDVLDRIDDYTQYIPDTNQRGVLLGDRSIERIRDRLYRQATQVIHDADFEFQRAFEVGISIGTGARLRFDEEDFRTAFEKDPVGVRRFFTKVTSDKGDGPSYVGFAARFNQMLDELTNNQTGLIAQENNRLNDRVELFNKRAAQLQVLLDQKEARLYRQFQGMERALADLQAQQSSLAILSNMANSFSANSGGIAFT